MAHDLYLVQVKTPAESEDPWDFVKLVDTIPPDQPFPSARPQRVQPCR
jgi:branched-chain amino acid transport system substrate-binding protein